ncbi:MAG: hypothetical protein OIF32_10515, partial [Campylobacterales bacterium]|nr:hypothetical protein [Campylobacterales bacterium]
MSKHIRIKGLILSSALSLALIGCTSSGEDTSSQGRDVSFGYELTSAYSGQNLNRSVITNRALEIFTGELLVTNVDTRDEETHPWSAYINEDDFSVTSNKTIVLKPGNYEFTLTLSKGNSQYVSETVYEIKDSDQVNIPFELKPVLGSLITNVDVVDEIPSFKFKYQLDEISSYDEPRIGITIDNGAQK